MRRKRTLFVAAVFVSMFGVVACGGEEKQQPAQQKATTEETTVAQPAEKTVAEEDTVNIDIGTPYEELPEEVKATMPEEVKQQIKQEQKQ